MSTLQRALSLFILVLATTTALPIESHAATQRTASISTHGTLKVRSNTTQFNITNLKIATLNATTNSTYFSTTNHNLTAEAPTKSLAKPADVPKPKQKHKEDTLPNVDGPVAGTFIGTGLVYIIGNFLKAMGWLI